MHSTVHPDAKGRITLGALAKGISSFEIHHGKNGQIILQPRVEIPAHEAWLFKNKKAQKMVHEGIQDAARGRVSNAREDYSKYVTTDGE